MTDTEPAVQAALSKMGDKYVWGADGPDTFDCSGLVEWAFKQAGITMTRTTYTQVLQGTPVSGPPQRGDLVFPDAGHVMIALGGNQGVHAPDTGDVVKVTTYWTTPFAVRRLGTNSGTPGSTDAHAQFGAPSANDVGFTDILDPFAPLRSLITFFNFLISQHGWQRMLKIMGGTVLIIAAMFFIAESYVKGIA